MKEEDIEKKIREAKLFKGGSEEPKVQYSSSSSDTEATILVTRRICQSVPSHPKGICVDCDESHRWAKEWLSRRSYARTEATVDPLLTPNETAQKESQ